jgi:hypothetical protein
MTADTAAIAAIVEKSTEEQHVPLVVSDPASVSRIAVLLSATTNSKPRLSRSRGRRAS